MANDIKQAMIFINKVTEKLTNSRKSGLWRRLELLNDKIISRMFDGQGGQYGRDKWKPIKETIYGKKRTGSDGLNYGRYSVSSLPLQASGNYRGSHKLLMQTPLSMRYGSSFSDKMTSWMTNAGQGGRVAMPDSNSSEYMGEMDRVTSQYLNDVITEAFNASR